VRRSRPDVADATPKNVRTAIEIARAGRVSYLQATGKMSTGQVLMFAAKMQHQDGGPEVLIRNEGPWLHVPGRLVERPAAALHADRDRDVRPPQVLRPSGLTPIQKGIR